MVEDASDDEDEDYVQPKRIRQEPPSPNRIYCTDGKEYIDETESGILLVLVNSDFIVKLRSHVFLFNAGREKKDKKS